jgi:hypothetical protein
MKKAVNPDQVLSAKQVPEARTREEHEAAVERLAWLMDRSISIGPYSIGLDPIIGLIPGVGDIFGTVVSTYIVVQAHKSGLPRATLLRMVTNVGIDAALGAVPFVGDVFDFAFKANTRNLALYREAVTGQRHASRDVWFLVLLFLALAIILMVPILALIWLVRSLF